MITSTNTELPPRQVVAEGIISTVIKRKRVGCEIRDYGCWIEVEIYFGLFYQHRIKIKLDEVNHDRFHPEDVSLLTDYSGEKPPKVAVYLGWGEKFFSYVSFETFLEVHREYSRCKDRKENKEFDRDLKKADKLAMKFQRRLKVGRGKRFYYPQDTIDALNFLKEPKGNLRLAPLSVLQMESEFIKLRYFYKTHHCDTKQHDNENKGND